LTWEEAGKRKRWKSVWKGEWTSFSLNTSSSRMAGRNFYKIKRIAAAKRDIWERDIVPSIMRKYQNMKYNLNNDIKSIYMSISTHLWYHAFTVLANYTDINFILCINTEEDNMVLYPYE
jgi:hypothetical protein